MDDFIKKIANFDKINQIYSNDLITIKSITQYLGIWNDLSDLEKEELEKMTAIDSYMNGHKDDYLSKVEKLEEDLGYGEITKSGTNTLYNYIKNNIQISDDDIFYDIGSGHGKLILHLALISDFKFLKGVEIDKYRHLYSLDIKSKIDGIDNVIFINDDIRKLDISDAKIVFMNDTIFSKELISSIIEKLNTGTHIISFEENKLNQIGYLALNVSWMLSPVYFRHYIK
jgi:hypothetical protein